MRDIMNADLVLNKKWKMMNILDKNKKIECEDLIESLLYKIITMILRANKADKIVSQKNIKSTLEQNLMEDRLQEKFSHFVFLLKMIISKKDLQMSSKKS